MQTSHLLVMSNVIEVSLCKSVTGDWLLLDISGDEHDDFSRGIIRKRIENTLKGRILLLSIAER